MEIQCFTVFYGGIDVTFSLLYNILRPQDILWEHFIKLRPQDIILRERDIIWWSQDIILWERDIEASILLQPMKMVVSSRYF